MSAVVDLQSFVMELQRGRPPLTGPVTHIRCPLSVKQGAEDVALSMGGTVVTRPNGATRVWSLPSGFHLKVSRSSATCRNEVAFYRLASNGSEHCIYMVWTARLFISISRSRENEAHLILTDTVCGLPCSGVQLKTARDLLFEETGWKHININVGNGFLDSHGQRAILTDFEDVIPPSSNGVTLSVDVSSGGVDDGTVLELTPKSPGSHDNSSLVIMPNECPTVDQVTKAFYLTASSRRKLGTRPLGICFQHSILKSCGESSGRIVVIDVICNGYMWNLGLQVLDEAILDIIL